MNPLRLARLLIFLLISGVVSSSVQADAPEKNASFRKSTFHLGLTQAQYALTGKEDTSLIGNSSIVNLGGGFIHEKYFHLYSLNVILGPYQPLSESHARLDFSGTGFSTTWGWTWSPSLRAKSHVFGVLMGAQYVDIVGRSVGTRREETGTISQLVTQIYDFAVVPGFFYANLKPPRPIGNEPENLVTRLEGLIISLGVAFPIQADFTQEYLRRDNTTGSTEKVKSRGKLDGRTYILQVISPLGI